MQTEFRAIVHGEYGAAEDVLGLAERQSKCEKLRPDDVLAHVAARPVHPCDIRILQLFPREGRLFQFRKGLSEQAGGPLAVGNLFEEGERHK